MTIKELIDKLNKYCDENKVYDIEKIGGDILECLDNLDFSYITSVDDDEHRWYVLSLNVYSVNIDGEKHYIGAWEVETLKSECMSVSDCCNQLKFFEMEQYTTVSYRPKKEKHTLP